MNNVSNNKKKSKFDEFIENYDNLKKQNEIKNIKRSKLITNSYASIITLKNDLEKGIKELVEYSGAFFLLKQKYGIISAEFFAANETSLIKGLKRLQTEYHKKIMFRLATKKEEEKQKFKNIFLEANFTETDQLIRITHGSRKSDYLDQFINEIIKKIPPELKHVGVAIEQEANSIQNILLSEFDPITDDLPTVEEILDDIKNQSVFVCRNTNNEITALTYERVDLQNKCINYLYEVTLPAYRKSWIYYLLNTFRDKYLKEKYPGIKKGYGWRNVKKNRLISNSIKMFSDYLDGTVISIFSNEGIK